jgi:hypothetical protein
VSWIRVTFRIKWDSTNYWQVDLQKCVHCCKFLPFLPVHFVKTLFAKFRHIYERNFAKVTFNFIFSYFAKEIYCRIHPIWAPFIMARMCYTGIGEPNAKNIDKILSVDCSCQISIIYHQFFFRSTEPLIKNIIRLTA